MSAQHTPGPWEQSIKGYDTEFLEGEWEIAICAVDKGDGDLPPMIAAVTNLSLVDEEAEANAKLISAAPELLYALQELMTCKHGEFCDHYPAAYKKARAAIAKATGGAA